MSKMILNEYDFCIAILLIICNPYMLNDVILCNAKLAHNLSTLFHVCTVTDKSVPLM